jgi:hypothetical protein
VIGEKLQIRSVTLQDVVEAHGRPAFVSAEFIEVFRLRFPIRACADRYFHPGKQIGQAAAGIEAGCAAHVAVELLPHLIEAVHRTGGIVVIGEA